jgi:hypothetical protein
VEETAQEGDNGSNEERASKSMRTQHTLEAVPFRIASVSRNLLHLLGALPVFNAFRSAAKAKAAQPSMARGTAEALPFPNPIEDVGELKPAALLSNGEFFRRL